MRSFTTPGQLPFFNQLKQASLSAVAFTKAGKFILLLLPLLLLSWSSIAQPVTQGTALKFYPMPGTATQPTTTTPFRIDWVQGTGTNNMLVVISDSTSTFTPAPNTQYTASTDFTAGSDIGTGTGKSVVVYNGLASAQTVTNITNLVAGSPYRVQIFEYSGTLLGANNDELYNTNSSSDNPQIFKYFLSTPTGKWWAPAGVTSAIVNAWGGGGGTGNSGGANRSCNGGGGGAWAGGSVTVVPGTGYTVTVGTGGAGYVTATNGDAGLNSSFAASVIAVGGGGSTNTGPGTGGTGSTGPSSQNGGAGGNRVSGANTPGGGGGGAGGTTAGGTAGGAASGATAGTGSSGGSIGGGSGGNGGANTVAGTRGSFPGGGGGGEGANGGTSGAGGNGLVIVSYTPAEAPTFVSANTSTTTLVKVKFNSTITSVAQANGSGFTLTGVTITAAAIDGGDPTTVNLTVNALSPDFSCSSCLNVAAGAVSNLAGGNLVITNQNLTDGIAPSVVSSTPVVTSANNGIIPRAGTITATTGANTVVGVGTSFLTELAAGAIIKNATGTVIGTVANISDNLNLTLTANGAIAATAEAYTVGLYYTVVFNEAVTSASLTAADFDANGTGTGTVGTISPSVGNATTYIVNVTPTGSGTLKLDKSINAYNDVAGNVSNVAFTSGTNTTLDVTGPDATASTPVTVANTNGIIPRTGTITANLGSPNVVGVGTSFLTELAVGAIIKNSAGGVVGTVLNIADNLNLTLTANASVAMAGDNYAVGLYYTVTFNELTQATSITSADFTLSGTGTGTIGTIAPAAGTSTTFVVNVNPTSSGTLELEKSNNARLDAFGNSSVTTFNGGTSANIDLTGPSVTGIVPVTVSNTNGIIPRTGTITSGLASPAVTGVGTSFLTELVPGVIIKDATGGVIGTVLSIADNTNLTLTANASLALAAQTYTMGLYYTVTFDEATQATSITSADFALTGTGAGTVGSIFPTSSNSTTYIVNVNPTGSGTLELEKNADPRLDALGNSSVTTFNAGTSANIDATGPSVTSIAPVTTALTNGVIPRTGTVTTTLASPTVTGVGTAFLTEFVVGSIVKTSSGTALGTVLSITNNTTMTLTANASVALTGQTYAMGLYYTVTFDEATAASSITAADFTLSGTATGTFGSISPSVGNSTTFIVNINPTTGGTLELEKNNDPRLDALGNASVTTFNSGTSANIDVSAPSITGVSIPDAAMKVGSVVSVDIAVADDGGDVYTLVSGTVGGFNLTAFARSSNVLYTAQFTVTNGGTDVTAAATIPVNVILADPANNQSTAFVTAINQAADPIDANLPATATVTSSGVTAPVVANYYNSYNTGVNITIPQAAMNDASLNGGTYEIWVNSTNSTAGATLLVAATAIGPLDINTNKVVFVNHATLSGNGEYADPGTLYFFVILTDAATNATTGNVSTVLNVDRGVPAAPAVPNLAAADDTGFKNDDNITKNTSALTFTGTAEANTTVSIYNNGVTLLNSGTATGGNYSIDLAVGEGTYVIAATATDAAGNISAFSSNLSPNLIVDTTPPTTGAMTLNPGENITWTFSEAVTAITNGSGGSLANYTMTGFTRSGGYEAIGASTYTNSTLVGSITSAGGAGNNWDAAITIGYAPGNINDVAGNAMVTFSGASVTDTNPPLLITGLVFNPNGTGNLETITFNVSETLTPTEGANLTGFSTSQGPALLSSQVVYTSRGTNNTITITSANDGDWNDNVTLTYSGSGNVRDIALNHLSMPAGEPIYLQDINIFSNNPVNTAYATTGNVITLQFTTSRAPSATPTVSIAGSAAVVSGAHPNWTATSISLLSTTPEAAIAFSITVPETGKSTTTTFTTNSPIGSAVIFDKTAPLAPGVIDLDDADDTGISDTDNTTKNNSNLDFSGTAEANSIVELFDGAVSLGTTTADGLGAYAFSGIALSEGFHNITTRATDQANNTSPASPILKVKVDTTPPSPIVFRIDRFSPTPNAWSTTGGIDNATPLGQSIAFKVAFAEKINMGSLLPSDFNLILDSGFPPGVAISNGIISVVPDGTYPDSVAVVTLATTLGIGRFTIDFKDNGNVEDAAGNPALGTASFPNNSFTGTSFSTLVYREPDFNTSIALNYVDEYEINIRINHGTGTQNPTHYLVMVKESLRPAAFPAVPDGVRLTDDLSDGNWLSGDGLFITNVQRNPFGASQTVSLYPIRTGMNYDVRVYPYTYQASYTDDNINYAAPQNLTNIPNPVNPQSYITYSSPSSDLSSEASSSSKHTAFQFTVHDGSGFTGLDFAPTKISGITFNKPAVAGALSTWLNVIAGAELYDVANPTVFVSASSITANSIVFSGIPAVNSGDLGYVPATDYWNTGIEGTKTFGLRIWLNNTSAALNGLDNQIFSVSFNDTNLTYYNGAGTLADHQESDRLYAGQTATSGSNTLRIIANKFDFTTNLPSTIGVKHPFLIAPVIEARDANDNIDVNYPATNYSLSLSNGAMNFGPSATPNNFVNGVLTLSSFVFDDPGATTVTISAPGITSATSDSDGGTGGNQNTTAVISGTTAVSQVAVTTTVPSIATFAPGTLVVIGQQNGVVNFSFTVTDDFGVGAAVDDVLPTRISSIVIRRDGANGTATGGATFDNWTNSIAGARLRVGTNDVPATVAINADNITFTAIPNGAAADLGYVADNGSRTYTLSIWLLNPVAAGLRDILDGEDFVFSLTDDTDLGISSSVGNYSSTLNTTFGAFTSGDGNNAVTVVATQLDYITAAWDPAQSPTGPSQSYDADISPAAQLKARDANQNLDRGFSGSPTYDATVTFFDSNTGDAITYPTVNGGGMTFTTGQLTLNSNLQLGSSGNGTSGTTTNIVVTSNGLTGTSSPFTINYSQESDIVKDATFTTYTSNIQTINNREALNLTSANSIALERFEVRDGGVDLLDTDGSNTKLTSITLNVDQWTNIRRIGIYNGATEIKELDSLSFIDQGDGTANITFSAFANPFEVEDNEAPSGTGTAQLTVRASFKAFVTDNQQMRIRVVSAATSGVSSQFATTATAFAALTTYQNRTEVVATKVVFDNLPATASISVPVVATGVIVSARDAYGNVDADYNGTISATSNTNTGSFNTINNPATTSPAGDFVGGYFTYPTAFQFDIGNGNVQLTINSGTGSGANNVNAAAIAGTSAVINVISSFESWITGANKYIMYTPPAIINYQNHQAADIQFNGDSFEMMKLALSDGDADTNGDDTGDADGAKTVLNSFTLAIKNFQALRSIALYDSANTEVEEIDMTNASNYTVIAADSVHVTFDAAAVATKLVANDDRQHIFSIRASFLNTAPEITDNTPVQLGFAGAVLGIGSKFYDQPPLSGTYIAGNPPDQVSAPLNINVIEVTAISLDFEQPGPSFARTQPSAIAGKQEPIDGLTDPTGRFQTSTGGSTGFVYARDRFGLLDVDFNAPIDLFTSPGASPVLILPSNFQNGVLDLDSMYYQAAGNGTLSIEAGGLNSSNVYQNTTGTISTSGTAVTGTGTRFLTEVSVGSTISIVGGGEIGKVASIASNTSLTLVAPALVTATNNNFNTNSVPSSRVDVIHVTVANYVANYVEGGPTAMEVSLKGGSTNKSIYAFEIYPEHETGTDPTLTRFSIIFRDANGDPYPYKDGATYGTVFRNPRLSIELNGSLSTFTAYTLQEEQTAALAALGSTIPKDKLTFVLSPGVALFGRSVRTKFVLTVDVDVKANNGYPGIIPMVVDKGYGLPTNGNILTNVGSSEGEAIGKTYKFASTKPPVLTKTYPFNGQPNVNPALDSVLLYFDVEVVSFDGVVKLWERSSNTLVATLQADFPTAALNTTGKYGIFKTGFTGIKDSVSNVLKFKIPTGVVLDPDNVYYITVEKGRFSNILESDRAGIADGDFNMYGGISYNADFYFKTASPNPPQLLETIPGSYFYTPTTGSFNMRFDQAGTVYYMIVESTAPLATDVTNNQILGIDPYTASTVVLRDSAKIDQLSPNFTWITFNASLTNDVIYRVYAFGKNDAEPTLITAISPYGSNYALDPDGAINTPTLLLKKENANSNYIGGPNFEICNNSVVKLEQPIVISERALQPGGFSDIAYGTGIQKFNILLPKDFIFEIDSIPTVTFSNTADFQTVPLAANQVPANQRAVFINSTLLEVSFKNSGNASLDNIVITNIYVKAITTGAASGPILRFYGAGLDIVPHNTPLATINAGAPATIDFTNSYNEFTEYNFSALWNKVDPTGTVIDPDTRVTYIPDHFNPNDFIVKLIPIQDPGDWFASKFTATGVTNDELKLTAVETDAAFNVTLTHTDPAGCYSENAIQYLVYDHTEAIPELLKTEAEIIADGGTPGYHIETTRDDGVTLTEGTRIGLIPGPVLALVNKPGIPDSTRNANDIVSNVGKAGYKLMELYADIATDTLRFNKDPNWTPLVNNIVKTTGLNFDPVTLNTFKDFSWEYSGLVNPDSAAIYRVTYPYEDNTAIPNYTRRFSTAQNRLYFDASILGKIVYTGVYQSIADFSVFVPFRQEVEIHLPAVPVIEVVGESARLGWTGTAADQIYKPIFCENGVTFNITGYPNIGATPAPATMFFTLYDSADYAFAVANNQALPTPITSAGFIDNGNGTATFDPTQTALKNGYRTIRIAYTYQRDNSPAVGTGELFIRVTPAPVAKFLFASELTKKNPLKQGRPINDQSICEDNLVKFTNETDTVTVFNDPYDAQNRAIYNLRWQLGEQQVAGSTRNIKSDSLVAVRAAQTRPVPGFRNDLYISTLNDQNRLVWRTVEYTLKDTVNYRYKDFGTYVTTFQVSSRYNCSSPVLADTVYVGVIPAPAFTMSGVSTLDTVTVIAKSTIKSGLSYPQSDTLRSLWYYGDPFKEFADPDSITFVTDTTHRYTTAGHYKLTLLQRTRIQSFMAGPIEPGCEIAYQRDVIIVPGLDTLAVGKQITENFEDGFSGWQIDDGIKDDSVEAVPDQLSSWAYSDAEKLWKTEVAPGQAGYLPGERTYLYSPAFDFSHMERPMVSFDQSTNMFGNDGVAVDFSVDSLNIADPGKRWFRLGTDSTGSNWYNKAGIAANPGSQRDYFTGLVSGGYGWSNTGGIVNSRHTLSPDIPSIIPQTHVIFRFTIASIERDSSSGFQFDNFRVGERSRIVLIENFTNSTNSNTDVKAQAYFLINNFPPNPGEQALMDSVDIIKLNYHVGFPAQDPFNLLNPADPSARALYYGVTTTPNARMDGLNFATPTTGNLLSGWGRDGYNDRTLDLAAAEIKFDSAYNKNGAYRVKVTVNAIEPLPASTYLHVVLAERGLINAAANSLATQNSGETDFEYVVRKMLPTASGRKLSTNLNANDTEVFETVSWVPDQVFGPLDDMVAIVFLQDEVTKEIHQAAYKRINDPSLVTGIENPFTLKDIKVYPNPADRQLNIVFPNALEVDVPLTMFDPVGRITHSHVVKKGEESVTLETGGNSAGVYILQMNLGEGRMVRTKVIINHRE